MSQTTVQNHQEALNVLVQAAQAANKRGAFSLAESGLIASAVAIFTPPEAPPNEETIGENSGVTWDSQLDELADEEPPAQTE